MRPGCPDKPAPRDLALVLDAASRDFQAPKIAPTGWSTETKRPKTSQDALEGLCFSREVQRHLPAISPAFLGLLGAFIATSGYLVKVALGFATRAVANLVAQRTGEGPAPG